VLVVDDNATNRRILALQTAKWGMVCATPSPARGAAAGSQAGEAFDLAILDMHMPGMDGMALAARIRAAAPRCRWCCSARLGRKEAGDTGACSPPTWPSRCARASCSTRW
jgi:CheY-like chemotaxis protein